MRKIILVAGARPNFMKIAPIIEALRRYNLSQGKNRKNIEYKLVHTGQHYDAEMSDSFFRDLELPAPDIYLGVGSGLHAEQTGKVMLEFEKVVLKEKPDLVIVFGDVNSTLACAVVCSKFHHGRAAIPLAHVESGLRSFDRTMPEEINRIVTDNLSQFLFVTEKAGVVNLVKEGIDRKKIYLTGDTMIDSLVYFRGRFKKSNILRQFGLQKGNFALTTIHRPANVDNKKNLKKVISILSGISRTSAGYKDFKLVFPVHPRTLKMIKAFGLQNDFNKIYNLVITEPAGYSDFIRLLGDCAFVVTDSGGIQEEASFMRIPCLTLRDSFERPETIEIGSNTLCGLNEIMIVKKVKEIFTGKYKKGRVPKHMDGKASKRIVKILLNDL